MELLNYFFRCPGNDAQGVHALAHQRCDGCIDQSVTLELRTPLEGFGNEYDAVMTPLACAGVAGVLRTVVNDFEGQGRQFALQGQAKLLDFG